MFVGIVCIERFLVCISERSVKRVQLFCDRLDLIRIVYKRNFSFFNSMFCTSNPIVDECFSLLRRTGSFQNLCNENNVTVDND